MCRLVAYLGTEILMEDILVRPFNSIVMQSLHARESSVPTNGDGFGLGWYAQDISPYPALFTSVFPAWNDRNLLSITSKIQSNSFFAHVRAASAAGVSIYNCHPFVHKQWMFMHNGDIPNFIVMKRHLRHLLDDDIYNWIQGETDSEHAFALFLQLGKGKDLSNLKILAAVFLETVETIRGLAHQLGTPDSLSLNVCLSDGHRMLASRYCSNPKEKPESMHYHLGNCLFLNKVEKEKALFETHHGILVSSERLTIKDADWEEIPPNYLFLADKKGDVQLISMD